MKNQYFDFHVHPSMKPYLAEGKEEDRPDCWKIFKTPISITTSQGSLTQLWEGGVSLAVCCLYVMERPMTSSFLISHIATKLEPLSKEMLHFPSYIDSFERLKGEIQHFKKSVEENREGSGRRFHFIKSISEIDPYKINVILALEGSHALENFNTDIIDNLIAIKDKTQDYRFLYLTLTHLTQYPVCTHAYGMKLIKKNDQFKPKGFGLTEIGKRLVDMAYDESKGYRIYIDIKHMSAKSRMDLYEHRAEKGYGDIPIVATHMGISGISRPEDLMQYVQKEDGLRYKISRHNGFVMACYDRPEGLGDTHFNPWSINLYDYEIEIILDSDGLIGLNLDQRILGTKKVKGEYFDEREFYALITPRGDDDPFNNAEEELEFIEEPGTEGRDYKNRINQMKHLRHFCNNVLHVVYVGGERAWSKVCIGSDFDGLIDPVNICISSDEFPRLEEKMPEAFVELLQTAYKKDEKIPADFYLESDINDEEALYKELEGKARDIMYNNAFNWLSKYYQ